MTGHMTEQLALRYRPRTFADMIGQSLTALSLQKMVEKDAVPHALLFSGPSGTGKTSSARILAAAMNPEQADAIAAGSSIDVVEIDSASNGGVADVRRMMETLRFAASPNSRRVVIYDECHTITREGWNALLKPTEEDTGTTFIFVTTEPEKVHETVLSRLREFEFYRVAPYEIGQRLAQIVKAENIAIDGALLGHLAETANGNVRGAIMSLDQVWQTDISSLEQYVELRGETDKSPALMQAMMSGNFSSITAELEAQISSSANPYRVTNNLVQLLSDILVYRSGGKTEHVGAALQARKELAYMVDQNRVVAAMKIIWDLKTRVKASSNPASDVRLAVTLIGDLMSQGRQQPAPPATRPTEVAPPVETTTEPRKLTLSDLRKRN